MVELWYVVVVVVCVICCVIVALKLQYVLANISYEPIRLWNDGLQLQDLGIISFGI